MKKTILVLLVSVLAVCLVNTGLLIFMLLNGSTPASASEVVAEAEKIILSEEFANEKGLAEAKLSGKPMVVFFYTDWCGFCQKFAPTMKKILAKKDLRKKYEFAFVNMEDSDNEVYAKEFQIEGFPSLYVVGKSGKRQQISPPLLFTKDAEVSLPKKFEKYAN